jgi:hypothetical protein
MFFAMYFYGARNIESSNVHFKNKLFRKINKGHHLMHPKVQCW